MEWDAESREILAGATFSVFAPEGLRLELTGWGGGDGEPVQSLGLIHELGDDRWIEVESEIDAHDVSFEDEAAHLLGGLGDARVEVASDLGPLRAGSGTRDGRRGSASARPGGPGSAGRWRNP